MNPGAKRRLDEIFRTFRGELQIAESMLEDSRAETPCNNDKVKREEAFIRDQKQRVEIMEEALRKLEALDGK